MYVLRTLITVAHPNKVDGNAHKILLKIDSRSKRTDRPIECAIRHECCNKSDC